MPFTVYHPLSITNAVFLLKPNHFEYYAYFGPIYIDEDDTFANMKHNEAQLFKLDVISTSLEYILFLAYCRFHYWCQCLPISHGATLE